MKGLLVAQIFEMAELLMTENEGIYFIFENYIKNQILVCQPNYLGIEQSKNERFSHMGGGNLFCYSSRSSKMTPLGFEPALL